MGFGEGGTEGWVWLNPDHLLSLRSLRLSPGRPERRRRVREEGQRRTVKKERGGGGGRRTWKPLSQPAHCQNVPTEALCRGPPSCWAWGLGLQTGAGDPQRVPAWGVHGCVIHSHSLLHI